MLRQLSTILLALALAATTAVATAPAGAAQSTAPGDPSSADPAARLAALDEATLALADQVEAAQTDLATRRADLAVARAAADEAARQSGLARTEAAAVRVRVDDLVSASYSGARTSRLSALLVSQSPQELLDRMTALDLLGADTAEALALATSAVAAADDAQARATAGQDAAVQAEAAAVAVQDGLVAQRADLAAQSEEATTLLAELTAARQAPAQVAASQQVSTLRASRATATRDSLFVVPAEGRFTSGYGSRGGGTHNGIDIAAPIGTPIVSTADGVVVDSGPASGFGLWVRVRHGDGTVTLYGHNDQNLVSVGQQVSAGEQIATVGNRGQSTGPHLHFEVETPGGGSADPRAWLAERGVTV